MRHKSKNKTRPLFTLSLEMTRLVNETRCLLVPGVNSDIYTCSMCMQLIQEAVLGGSNGWRLRGHGFDSRIGSFFLIFFSPHPFFFPSPFFSISFFFSSPFLSFSFMLASPLQCSSIFLVLQVVSEYRCMILNTGFTVCVPGL